MGLGRFVRNVRVNPDIDMDSFPFTIPAIAYLADSGGINLAPGVTFLVGENGAGKSTLIEALAGAAGFNPEGGSKNFQFSTRASQSSLGADLILTWERKPRTGFFLRAESFYNVATEIERLNDDPHSGPLLPAYGGTSPHARSHGESFLDLVTHRFGPHGLYVLDEPEAALSVRGCMALLARLTDLADHDCQIVVATHSPILLALPGATILQITDTGTIEHTTYDQALPVHTTRDFLNAPQQFLHHLLTTDQTSDETPKSSVDMRRVFGRR